jgi:hypothetical protein
MHSGPEEERHIVLDAKINSEYDFDNDTQQLSIFKWGKQI